MQTLIGGIIFSVGILFSSCNYENSHNARQKDSNIVSDTSNTEIKTKNTVSEDDSELLNIVKEYKATYSKMYDFDTTFDSEKHSYRVNFSHKCLFDSSLTIPEKYVSIYRMKEFTTHNFQSSFALYKDGAEITNMNITKSVFSPLIDENLIKYGNLLYPRIKVGSNPFTVEINYSLSIPLTDIGKSVMLSFDNQGQQKLK